MKVRIFISLIACVLMLACKTKQVAKVDGEAIEQVNINEDEGELVFGDNMIGITKIKRKDFDLEAYVDSITKLYPLSNPSFVDSIKEKKVIRKCTPNGIHEYEIADDLPDIYRTVYPDVCFFYETLVPSTKSELLCSYNYIYYMYIRDHNELFSKMGYDKGSYLKERIQMLINLDDRAVDIIKGDYSFLDSLKSCNKEFEIRDENITFNLCTNINLYECYFLFEDDQILNYVIYNNERIVTFLLSSRYE